MHPRPVFARLLTRPKVMTASLLVATLLLLAGWSGLTAANAEGNPAAESSSDSVIPEPTPKPESNPEPSHSPDETQAVDSDGGSTTPTAPAATASNSPGDTVPAPPSTTPSPAASPDTAGAPAATARVETVKPEGAVRKPRSAAVIATLAAQGVVEALAEDAIPVPASEWSGPFGAPVSGAAGRLAAPPGGADWVHVRADRGNGQWVSETNISSSTPAVAGGQYLLEWDQAVTAEATFRMATGHRRLTGSSTGIAWQRHSALVGTAGESLAMVFAFRTSGTDGPRPEAGLANATITRTEPTIGDVSTVNMTVAERRVIRVPLTMASRCRSGDDTPLWVSVRITTDYETCEVVLEPTLGTQTGSFTFPVWVINIAGTLVDSTPVTVNLQPAVSGIALTPSSTTVQAGQPQAFEVKTVNPQGETLDDVTSDALVQISGDGECTDAECGSTKPGQYRVTATYQGFSAAADLTVVPADIDSLTITPASTTVAAGTRQRFAATARDRFGNLIGEVTDNTTFTGPDDLSCADDACWSNTVGSYRVTGTYQGHQGTAQLTVVAGAVGSIRVTPENQSTEAGVNRAFVATAFDEFDNRIGVVTNDTTFSVTGAATCAASSCGANVAGTYTVTGVYEGRRASAVLTVTPAALDSIKVTPGTASIVAGTAQAFVATSYDRFDNRIGVVTASTTFSGPGAVTCTGSSCTATVTGEYTVTGTHQGKSGAATLTVTPAPQASLQITPATAEIVAGTTREYRARSYDQFNNLIAEVTNATDFSASDVASCADNVCTAQKTGEYTVTGSHGAFADTATLTVVPAQFESISLTPATATVVAGATQEFTATSYDRFENVVAVVTTESNFMASEQATCTANACGSERVGTYLITADYQGAEATAELTVTPAALDSLVLTPGTSTSVAGVAQDFTATSYDRFDNEIAVVTPETTFSASGEAACTDSLCGSEQTGEYVITGSYEGLTATAALTVIPAGLNSLILDPKAASTAAGVKHGFSATAFDAFNNEIGDVTEAAAFTATGAASCEANQCGATKVGIYQVTATYTQPEPKSKKLVRQRAMARNTASASATLTVTPAELAALKVTPRSATIDLGAKESYKARGFDAYGNPHGDLTDKVKWTASGVATCANHACGADKAGSYRVSATLGETVGTAKLRVKEQAAAPAPAPAPAPAKTALPEIGSGIGWWHLSAAVLLLLAGFVAISRSRRTQREH